MTELTSALATLQAEAAAKNKPIIEQIQSSNKSKKEVSQTFKKRNKKNKKARNIRKKSNKTNADENEDGHEDGETQQGKQDGDQPINHDDESIKSLQETLRQQGLRKRRKGTSVADLQGKIDYTNPSTSDQPVNPDGSLSTTVDGHKSGLSKKDETDEFGKSFTGQSEHMQVDKRMEQYIQEKMQEMRGKGGEGVDGDDERRLTEEDALYVVPDHLKLDGDGDDAEVDMSGMAAIVEVELPIEHKLKNIEETERAKREWMEKRKQNRKNGGDGLWNQTVVHQRFGSATKGVFHGDKADDRKRKHPDQTNVNRAGEVSSVEGRGSGNGEEAGGHGHVDKRYRATDFLALQKFKKKEMNRRR